MPNTYTNDRLRQFIRIRTIFALVNAAVALAVIGLALYTVLS